MNKSDLVDWLQESYQQWGDLLDLVGTARMDVSGVNGDWSMKDIVAHLTGWNRSHVARLKAAQQGKPEPPSPWPAHVRSEDDINAWIYKTNRGRSIDEVLDESHYVFEQLLAVAESLPEDVQIDVVKNASGREYYPVWIGEERYLVGEFFDHFHDDHERDIRTWLARQEKR
jgi:hypothetical protein